MHKRADIPGLRYVRFEHWWSLLGFQLIVVLGHVCPTLAFWLQDNVTCMLQHTASEAPW